MALDVANDMFRLDLGYSQAASATGGLFVLDDRQTPDAQVAPFDYPNLSVVWELRHWSTHGTDGAANTDRRR